MLSAVLQSIITREITSKINILLDREKSEISSYKILLQGKGLDFTLTNVVSDSSDSEFDQISDITLDGVADMLNKQIDEYDFFNPRPLENFNFVVKNKVKTKKQGISGNMRLKMGRFTNPLQLSNLINMALVPFVLKRMGPTGSLANIQGPLVNRTGRLANSGFVTNIIANSDNVKTIYFTYQKRPYSVFEHPGTSKLASPTRDPRKLFANAITDVLRHLLHRDTLSTNRFGIRIGRYLVGSTTSGGNLNER